MSQRCFKLKARELFSAVILISMILSLSTGLIMTVKAQTPSPETPTVVPPATQTVEINPTEVIIKPTKISPTAAIQVPANQPTVQPTGLPPVKATAQSAAPIPQNEEKYWRISTDPDSGKVRFMGSDSANPIFTSASLGGISAQSSDVAVAFLAAFGTRFGIQDPAKELTITRTNTDQVGNISTRYQQLYNGVPVLGREMIVQTDGKQNVISASGKVSGGLSLDITPSVNPDTARQKAIDATAAEYPDEDPAQLAAKDANLWVYDSTALGFRSTRSVALVWKIIVSSKDNHPISEYVLVDAHNGQIVLHYSQAEFALNRNIYDCVVDHIFDGHIFYYCPLTRKEGSGLSGIADIDNAYDYFAYAYNFYKDRFNRDSMDNRGMKINAYLSLENYTSAWLGDSKTFQFSEGYAVLDLVGHEFTHAVTQYESGLQYINQSGSINDSLSDVFGEFIDQTYNKNLNPSDKWMIGQDLEDGWIRSMKDPTLESDPDKMSSENYNCNVDDNGAIHTNSGVNNKAAYLMTDGSAGESGGKFNGIAVSGIGLDKVADIYYKAQTDLLTSTAMYPDLYDALNQSCVDLEVSSDGITPDDCTNVKKALDAVEMDSSYPCTVNAYLYPTSTYVKAPLGTVATITPELNWELKTDSTRYQVWLKDSKKVTVYKQWVNGMDPSVCSKSTCKITTPALLYGSTYSWAVQTSNAVGDGLWSAWSKFSVTTQPVTMPTVNQTLPTGTITSITPSYQWDVIPGASDYLLRVISQNTSKSVFSLDLLASKVCSDTTCSATPPNKLSPGSFSWTVQAKYGKVAGPVGAALFFTIDTVPGPGLPINLSPTGPISSSQPKFSWGTVPGASSYILKLSGASGNIQKEYSASDPGCATDPSKCTVDSPKVLEGGLHKWTVQAKNGVGLGAISATAVFTISQPLDKAVLKSPVSTDNITTSRPLFSWSAVNLATTYVITVQGATKFAKSYTAANICDATTCNVDPGITLKANAHSWTVKASNKAGFSISDTANFNAPIPATAPGLVSLVVPANKAKVALASLTTLSWNAATATTDYLLVITGKGFSYSTSLSASKAGCPTVPAMCTTTVPNNLGYGTYTWSVTPFDQGVSGKKSAPFSFSTILPQPTVTEPVSGAPVTMAKLEFDWVNQADATRYDLLVTTTDAKPKTMYKSSVLPGLVCSAGLPSTCTVSITTFASGHYVLSISGYNPAGGIGQVYTETFTIAPLLDSEFDDPHTGAKGWDSVGDSGWWLSNGKWNVYGMPSLEYMFTENNGTYANLDYQVSLSLKGDRYAASDIQSITIHSAFDWYNIIDEGYEFNIRGEGDFSVYKLDGDWFDNYLQPWTYSSAINKGTSTTNILRVISYYDTNTNNETMYFYINGQLVWVGADLIAPDDSLASGEVGIGLWDYNNPTDMLSVDWARIYDAPTLQLHAQPSLEQQALNKAAASDVSGAAETSRPFAPGRKR